MLAKRRRAFQFLLWVLLVAAGCDSAPAGDTSGSHQTSSGGSTTTGGQVTLGGTSAVAGASLGGTSSFTTLADGGPNQKLQDYLGNSSYPDDFWTTATFAESNLDPAPFDQALDWIQSKGWEIHALLVARNGRLVFERYGWKSGNNPNDPDKTPHQMVPSERHPIFSVTKSIVSALVGCAIDDGFISGVDHKVADWFTDYAQLNPSEQKSTITLDYLLTMRSGLTFKEGEESAVFTDEPDPARALLARDLQTTPGSTWNYSSGDAEIVGEILRITTGITPLQYANTKLFGPLGIKDVPWDAGQSGTNHGGFGISLTAREMARIGELYRNNGVWANQQLLPATWVANATSFHFASTWGMDYGYYWFLPHLNDFFVAIGFNGQEIFVSRDDGLVIVFLGDLPSTEANIDYSQIITNYIVPAIR